MGKVEAVEAAKAKLQDSRAACGKQMLDAEQVALESVYDQGVADAPAGDTVAQLAALQSHLDSVQADLDKALSDDAADKAAVADRQKLLDGIRAILTPPVASAPADAPSDAPSTDGTPV